MISQNDSHFYSKKPVTVLGAGNWGTVLALLCANNADQVFLYDRDSIRAKKIDETRVNEKYLPGVILPKNIHISNDLKTILEASSLVFTVIPSSEFRTFIKSVAPFLRGDHFVIHGIKGLELHTYKRMSQILLEETPCIRVGAISGPNLASEIARKLPASTVVASKFMEVMDAATKILQSNYFYVHQCDDLIGVELVGAMKNILAIAAGMIHQLGLGQNATAMVITNGIEEINRLISTLGGSPETLLGLAGIGDIMTTCSSPLSRNFRAGQLLAEGKKTSIIRDELKITAEGIGTIYNAAEISRTKKLNLQLIENLALILSDTSILNTDKIRHLLKTHTQ